MGRSGPEGREGMVARVRDMCCTACEVKVKGIASQGEARGTKHRWEGYNASGVSVAGMPVELA